MTGVLEPLGAPALSGREADAATIGALKALQAAGDHSAARDCYADIVERHQRRAARIAYHYLRDAAEADEAVQDAFVRAYVHLASFRDDLPFDGWFTRILINGCLDRIKARDRRERRETPLEGSTEGATVLDRLASRTLSPEQVLLERERQRQLAAALDGLTNRQRTVFVLSHIEGCSSREVSELTGLNESTVRVHLFRAVRRLRELLGRADESPQARTTGRRSRN